MSYKTATPYTIQIIQTDNVVPMDELNKIDDAIDIVENGQIQVDFFDLGKFNGMLCERKKEYFMCINIKLDDNYKTKTILHELGHYMIHYNNRFRKLFFCHDMMVSHEEKEADYFAWWLMDDYLRERCKWNFFCLKL